MFERISEFWWRMHGIYPLYVLTVLLFIAYIYESEGLPILFMAAGSQFLYMLFQGAIKHSRKLEAEGIEPEDDPTGNTNVKRKFYDTM